MFQQWDVIGVIAFVIGGGLMFWYIYDRQSKRNYYYGTAKPKTRPSHKELGKVN